MARAHLVDPMVTRWYHCVTRCVRRAFLLSEEPFDRKLWIENLLQELADIFAVAVGGFSVMDNHLEPGSAGSLLTERFPRETKQGCSSRGISCCEVSDLD